MSSMKVNREDIVLMLESYRKNVVQIAVLRYELTHSAYVSDEEIIDSMAFSNHNEDGASQGCFPDRTLDIALQYHERACRLNAESTNEVLTKLIELEQETNRLEYYVGLLPKRYQMLLQKIYFDGETWERTASELDIAVRTAFTMRKRAIEKLTEFYTFAAKCGSADMQNSRRNMDE